MRETGWRHVLSVTAILTMPTGHSLIAGQAVAGTGDAFQACNPASGELLAPLYRSVTVSDVDQACTQALNAYPVFRRSSSGRRAELLDMIAEEIERDREKIVSRAMLETALPAARLESELGRTSGQLRLFARLLRSGKALDIRLTTPGSSDNSRPDQRQMKIGIGPVAVFGASNFPLAFSVAGGDSASALAAGCPIVVKAHPAHPGVSELTGRAVVRAVTRSGLPAGVFNLLFGQGHEPGMNLVRHTGIAAVGFTGSRSGGLALMKAATYRPVPIPVYAEMSSINPVFLLPTALSQRSAEIASDFAAALCLSAGQFCTNPGLLIAVEGDALQQFEAAAVAAIEAAPPQTMLSSGIHDAYVTGVEAFDASAHTTRLNVSVIGSSRRMSTASAALFACSAVDFLLDERLRDEVFGASALIVRCSSTQQLLDVARSLEGQLTAAIHVDDADHALAAEILPILETRCGRLVCNDFATGVSVSDAMVHGGPFPATSDGRSTSVGTGAIERWLRPVCYQGMPESLLPAELQSGNPLGISRRQDALLSS